MSDLSDGELERSAFDFGERKIEPVSPIDTNSRDNLLIDLTQLTLSSNSLKGQYHEDFTGVRPH